MSFETRFPYSVGHGFQASEECADLILAHVQRFLAERQAAEAASSCDNWESVHSDEAELKDRFIAALAEGKLDMLQAVAISSVLRDIAAIPFTRWFA